MAKNGIVKYQKPVSFTFVEAIERRMDADLKRFVDVVHHEFSLNVFTSFRIMLDLSSVTCGAKLTEFLEEIVSSYISSSFTGPYSQWYLADMSSEKVF